MNLQNPEYVELAGMPPTHVQVDVLDTLRDDGLIYEKLVRDHGVATRLGTYSYIPHAHWMLWPEHSLSMKSNIDTLCRIGWLLGREIGGGMSPRASGRQRLRWGPRFWTGNVLYIINVE
jgi:acetyl esterase/lipase